MDDAQGMINARRAGQEVHDQKIVDAFKAEIERVKANDPILFESLLKGMSDILKDNPPPAELV